MYQQLRPRAKWIAWMCMIVYFASYIMRINFTVLLVKVCSDMQVEKTALAVVVTGLTVTYGIGQIVSGFIGDKIRPQLLLSAGLASAGLCNIALFFCRSIPLMTVVWCLNGFSHALMWPPMVRLMSMYLTDEEYGYAAVRASWGSSFATIVLYLVCPLLLQVLHWRVILLLCAGVGLGILALWLAVSPKLLTEPLRDAPKAKSGAAQTAALPGFVYLPIGLIMLGIVLQGILRDGVTNWMPSYLLETFRLPEENAIIVTVVLALFSVVSFAAFDLLHRKLFKNEVFCSAVIFIASAVCSAALYFANTLGTTVAFSALLMAVVVACMHGINLMLITVVPKRFAKSGKVSTYSGLLNSCTYVGAALSTYGFAVLADRFGWSFTILTWVAVSIAGAAVCLLAASPWQRFRKEYADN